MKYTRKTKVIISWVLCLTIFVTSFAIFPKSMSASALDSSQLSQLQQQSQEIESRQAELDEKIEEARKNIEDQETLKDALQEKISSVEKQIDTTNQTIEQYNSQITDLNSQISNKEDEISSDYAALRKRLKVIYMAGEVSTVELILGSKDFGDFIDKVNLVKCLSAADQKIIDRLKGSITEINNDKDLAEDAKSKVNEEKQKLVSDRENLESLQKECDDLIAQLQGDQTELEEKNAEYDKEKANLENEMAQWLKEYYAQNGTQILPSDVAAGTYAWPAPSCPIITTDFTATHHGLDFACNGNAYGLPIVAAQDGTVIKANKTDTWGSGWGYYIMIDHGGSFATLYAHCSVIVTDIGATVKKGQVIGYIGNTGNSFGAHLHFECWYNGERYNPRYSLGIIE